MFDKIASDAAGGLLALVGYLRNPGLTRATMSAKSVLWNALRACRPSRHLSSILGSALYLAEFVWGR